MSKTWRLLGRKTTVTVTTCQSGRSVYRRGTGSGWPPLGATTLRKLLR